MTSKTTFYTVGSQHWFPTVAQATAFRVEMLKQGYDMSVEEWTEQDAYGTVRDTRGTELLAEQRNALIDFDGTDRPKHRAPKVGRRYPLLRR